MWNGCQIKFWLKFPICRYVGENYSDAQEAMEQAMSAFYNHSPGRSPLSQALVGQLVAVRDEDGDAVTRAQVIELVSPDKVKVRSLAVCTPRCFL